MSSVPEIILISNYANYSMNKQLCFGFFMKFALFCSQKTTVRVKLKFGVQVRKPFLILCTKFET